MRSRTSGPGYKDRDDDDERRARAETLVVGFFACNDFHPEDGPRQSGADWAFQGWEGVGAFGAAPEHQPFHTFLEAQGNFGAACRGLTQEIQSVAQALGCGTGLIRVEPDEPGAFAQVFGFTCSGRRDHVVGTMAEISRAILEFRP